MENLSLHTANAVSFHDTLLLIFHTQNIKKENSTEFVYGKGKRKSKLQKYYESIQEFIEKQIKFTFSLSAG